MLAGLCNGLAGDVAHAAIAGAPDGRPAVLGRACAWVIGHGGPMTALHDNARSRRLRPSGREIGQPRAILLISAHWLTGHYTRLG